MNGVVVVHQRDSDYSCTIQVFVNGTPVPHEEISVDPGAGYTRDDWEVAMEDDLNSATEHGPHVLAAVRAAYDSASESEHITD